MTLPLLDLINKAIILLRLLVLVLVQKAIYLTSDLVVVYMLLVSLKNGNQSKYYPGGSF